MPRRLLRNGTVVEDDWRTLDEGPADAGSALILSFEQWHSERARWLERPGRLGVILAPTDALERLVPDLARFELLGAHFPNPSEGRGYTQGRLLRERWHFRGELRASGHIGRDHVFFLARCGFNSFELPDGEIDTARAALFTFSAAYQPCNDAGLMAPLRHR